MVAHTVASHIMEDEAEDVTDEADLVDEESTHLFVRNLPAFYGVQLVKSDRNSEHALDLFVADWKTPRQGDIVARRYRIGEHLRRTGHVVTMSARHLELEQSVTLTYLAAPACADARAVDIFSRGARLASRVSNARTARVLDVGRLVFGAPFVVMEQLPGWTFAEVLRMRGRLPVNEAAELVAQACRAVQDAQAAGFRRIGPNMTNLVVTRESDGASVVKTVLFGAESAALEHLHQNDPAWGDDGDELLLPYLSPEDVRDPFADGGERADVWSLGAVFFELYTGARAFAGASTIRLLSRIVADAPLELYALRPESPPDVRDIVEPCLTKDPFARFASVDELATALGNLVRGSEAARSTRRSPHESAPVARVNRPLPPPVVAPSVDSGAGASLKDRALTLGVGVAIGVLAVAAIQVVAHGFGGTRAVVGPHAAAAEIAALPSARRP